MVEVSTGDLFESKAQTLVNTVNTVGIMGKGIALDFKKRFPEMYKDYVDRCSAGQVRLGRPYLYRRNVTPWILNFPTKQHWRSATRLQDLILGLRYLEAHYLEWGITSLAVPPLGCGYGYLEWAVVGPTLYRHLSHLKIPVELYAPYGTPKTEMEKTFLTEPTAKGSKEPSLTRIKLEWIVLIEILSRIEQEPYHWPVGRVLFQKIAYFATEAGLDTGLSYSRSSFGPYAPDLKMKTAQLINNGLIYEEMLGTKFAISVGPTYKDARKAYRQELEQYESIIDLVTDLILRIRNTRQAEVAATVHFGARLLSNEPNRIPSENDLLFYVMDWKQKRNPPFDAVEVATTIRSLATLGWLTVEPSKELPIPEDDAIYA